jgi:hypothetical protein
MTVDFVFEESKFIIFFNIYFYVLNRKKERERVNGFAIKIGKIKTNKERISF